METVLNQLKAVIQVNKAKSSAEQLQFLVQTAQTSESAVVRYKCIQIISQILLQQCKSLGDSTLVEYIQSHSLSLHLKLQLLSFLSKETHSIEYLYHVSQTALSLLDQVLYSDLKLKEEFSAIVVKLLSNLSELTKAEKAEECLQQLQMVSLLMEENDANTPSTSMLLHYNVLQFFSLLCECGIYPDDIIIALKISQQCIATTTTTATEPERVLAMNTTAVERIHVSVCVKMIAALTHPNKISTSIPSLQQTIALLNIGQQLSIDRYFDLFEDEDDTLIDSMNDWLTVYQYLSKGSANDFLQLINELQLQPQSIFAEFLQRIGYDELVLLDFLISDETKFLSYLVRYLHFVIDSKSECSSQEEYLCMSTLSQKINRANKKKLFPYNPTPLLHLLHTVYQ